MKEGLTKYSLFVVAIFCVFFASFCSSFEGGWVGNLNLNANQTYDVGKGNTNVINLGNDLTFCMHAKSYNAGCNFTATYGNESVSLNSSNAQQIACINHVSVSTNEGVPAHNNGSSYCEAMYFFFPSNAFPSTILECQQNYSLIPIDSVDQNYCTSNNLCPSDGTPSDCPNVGVSNLYINDLFHPGAFNIIMNIPEEIDWDYAYTNSGQNFNIDVVGYNQDFEKIEGWIQTNNYKPTSEDFTNIFTSGFSNFGGLLVATLFVILVFYFVKKMFK